MKATLRNDRTGVVFNIQKYSVHDGPGIRTVVFLKGCPLSCTWCSNPESQLPMPQLAYSQRKCLSISECLRCAEVCPSGALVTDHNDKARVHWPNCRHCLACTEVCPAGALIAYGEQKTVHEIVDLVEEDALFYARSGGGLTLGGGEPLAQPEFAIAILKEAKRRHIKTAIETCGHVAEKALLRAGQYCNTVLFDIKSMNSEKHRLYTGKGNNQILDNFTALRQEFPRLSIRVRTPVIPGFNDTKEDIQAIIDFIGPSGVEYELLPYHRLGTQKYESMGKPYELGDVALDSNRFLDLKDIVPKATRVS